MIARNDKHLALKTEANQKIAEMLKKAVYMVIFA